MPARLQMEGFTWTMMELALSDDQAIAIQAPFFSLNN
jgi:hypothetical protein